jgi:hypothetical protein
MPISILKYFNIDILRLITQAYARQADHSGLVEAGYN